VGIVATSDPLLETSTTGLRAIEAALAPGVAGILPSDNEIVGTYVALLRRCDPAGQLYGVHCAVGDLQMYLGKDAIIPRCSGERAAWCRTLASALWAKSWPEVRVSETTSMLLAALSRTTGDAGTWLIVDLVEFLLIGRGERLAEAFDSPGNIQRFAEVATDHARPLRDRKMIVKLLMLREPDLAPMFMTGSARALALEAIDQVCQQGTEMDWPKFAKAFHLFVSDDSDIDAGERRILSRCRSVVLSVTGGSAEEP
jgi:hypothetical protein